MRVRFDLIALLLFMGIALNIERLDFGAKEDVVNLASFVYLLYGVAVISTVLMPRRWKFSTSNVVVFWIVIYLSIKIMMSQDRPLFGGVYTYLTIAELFTLITLLVLTRKVMGNLNNLEKTIANITLVDVSNRVKSLEEGMPDVKKEFVRSRRYKRPLGVIVVKPESENTQATIDSISQDILRTMMSRYSMSNLIRLIDRNIRRPDLILEQYEENRIILLLPEADLDAATTVSRNIQEIAQKGIGAKVKTGIAAFPDDAISFDDLVSHAELQLKDTDGEELGKRS